MRSVFAVLSLLVAAVTAAPLVFDDHLLKYGDVEGRVAVLKHVTHRGEALVGAGKAPVLRLVYLVPALHKVHALSLDGFASKHFSGVAKHHAFTKLPAHELLVDLVGVSDCATWYGVLLHVWDHVARVAHHRAFGYFKGDLLHLDGVVALADFVKTHAGLTLLTGFVRSADLPAHLLTHHLHALL